MESKYKKGSLGYLNELAKNKGFGNWIEYYRYLVKKKLESLNKDNKQIKKIRRKRKQLNRLDEKYKNYDEIYEEKLGENLSGIILAINYKEKKEIIKDLKKLGKIYGDRWMEMKWNVGFDAVDALR